MKEYLVNHSENPPLLYYVCERIANRHLLRACTAPAEAPLIISDRMVPTAATSGQHSIPTEPHQAHIIRELVEARPNAGAGEAAKTQAS